MIPVIISAVAAGLKTGTSSRQDCGVEGSWVGVPRRCSPEGGRGNCADVELGDARATPLSMPGGGGVGNGGGGSGGAGGGGTSPILLLTFVVTCTEAAGSESDSEYSYLFLQHVSEPCK